MKKIIILLFILFPLLDTLAQEQKTDVQENEETPVCTQNLRLARSLYEEGKLNEIPPTLNSCLNKIEADGEFSPDEKVEAYRLIAITYLYLDEPAKADEAMLELLHTDPEYVVDERLDPAEYINLYRSFRTKWLFRWGIKGGGNYTLPYVIQTYSVTNPGEFGGQIGFQVGALAEFDNLIKYVVIQPELLFTKKSYSFETVPLDKEITSDSNNESIANDPDLSDSELSAPVNLTYVELFITGKYPLWKNKNYYALLSPGVGYLLNAEIPSAELDSDESAKILRTGQYNRLNPQVFIGVGTEIKFGRFYALADLRYGYSLINAVNKDNRYSDPVQNIQRGLPESDFKLHTVVFSLSLIRASYRPKKLDN